MQSKKQRGRVTADLPLEHYVWMKDHPEKTRADHLRDAVAQYISSYGSPIGPNTKITVATPDGPQPYRPKLQQAPPTYVFRPDARPEIDPSTGKPIE